MPLGQELLTQIRVQEQEPFTEFLTEYVAEFDQLTPTQLQMLIRMQPWYRSCGAGLRRPPVAAQTVAIQWQDENDKRERSG